MKTKTEYEFWAIVQDEHQRKMDKFMHACDVFEKGKRLGKLSNVTIKTDDKIKSPFAACKALRNLYEMADGTVLLLIEKESGINYVCSDVQTISDGEKFYLFKDMINMLGYEVETDEFMNVTHIEKP